jgi:septum site-determining protein MinC
MTLTRSGKQNTSSKPYRSAVVRVVGRGRQAEVVIDDVLPFAQLEQGVRAHLARNPHWWEGAQVTLNVGRRVLSIKEVTHIKEMMEREFKLTIAGLWCGPEILETLIAQNVNIPVDVAPEHKAHVETANPASASTEPVEPVWQETMLFKGTCRSGTTIHNSGNLVVLGDVNPGAELTAAGDIIVFGRLTGLAHAGVEGNIRATILATSIDAAQVRIGPYIRMEGGESNGHKAGKANSGLPALARVEQRQVIIEPYVTSSIWRRYN